MLKELTIQIHVPDLPEGTFVNLNYDRLWIVGKVIGTTKRASGTWDADEHGNVIAVATTAFKYIIKCGAGSRDRYNYSFEGKEVAIPASVVEDWIENQKTDPTPGDAPEESEA